jgi:hypothetical protein
MEILHQILPLTYPAHKKQLFDVDQFDNKFLNYEQCPFTLLLWSWIFSPGPDLLFDRLSFVY